MPAPRIDPRTEREAERAVTLTRRAPREMPHENGMPAAFGAVAEGARASVGPSAHRHSQGATMRFRRSARFIALSAAAIAASASTLAAQGRPLFDWRGRVNSEVFITMRGEQTWTRVADRDARAGGRASVQTA